jgi:hypothetical protein
MGQPGHPERCTVQAHKSCPQASGFVPLKDPPREKERRRDSLRAGLAH